MPLGIARLNTLSRYIEEAAPVAQRTANTLTTEQGATLSTTQYKFGSSSLTVDGTSNLTVDNSTGTNLIDLNNNWTIEFWYYTPGNSGFDMLAGAWGSSSTSRGLFIGLNNSSQPTIYMNSGSGDVSFTGSNGTHSNNTWHHMALVNTGSDIKLYIDGTLDASYGSSFSFNSSITYNHTFGRSDTGGDAAVSGTYIDEIRYSDTVRYTGNFTPSTTPFVNDADTLLLVHADGSNGDIAFIDDNGERAPVALESISEAITTDTQSKFGNNSMRFDGATNTDQRLYAYDAATNIGSGDFTLECWARFDDFSALHAVTYIGGQAFYVGSDGKISYYYGSGTSGTTVMSTNTWYHLAWSRSGTSLRLFVNGNLEATRTDSTTLGADLLLGCKNANDQDMRGYMDEYRFSDTARYTASFTAPTQEFTNDTDTRMLLHFEPVAGSKTVFDDNGQDIPTFSLPVTTLDRPLTITPIGNAQVDTQYKKFGTGSLLPSGGRLEVEMDMPTGDFTIESWNYITNRSAPSGLWEIRGDTNTSHRLALYGGEAGGGFKVLYLTYRDTSGTEQIDIVTPTNTFPDTTWKHCAVTKNGNTFTVWIDGVNRGSATYSSFEMPDTTTLHTGGAITSGRYFRGNVDDFRVSDTARYSSSFTKPSSAFSNDSNTLFLCHFDGTDGSTTFSDDNS